MDRSDESSHPSKKFTKKNVIQQRFVVVWYGMRLDYE